MDDSRKWVVSSAIPLIILIAIMVSTRSWGSLFDFNKQEEWIYRINDYQYHEPIISWWELYRSDWWHYKWAYSEVFTEKPKKKRNWFWTMYYPDWCILTGNRVNWVVEWNWTYDCNEWIYSWEFKNNMFNGLWILVNKDWSYYSWEWLNEQPNWYWILKYADWEIYEWYWVEWTKEWTWKYITKAGNIFEWMYVKGLRNWSWKVIYPDWTIQEWIWIDDIYQQPAIEESAEVWIWGIEE